MIPSILYQQQTSSEWVFGRRPSPIISPQRLINGRPYFTQMGAASDKKPKTLLLHDWRLPFYHGEDLLKSVINKLSELIDAGFEIYRPLGKGYQKLSKKKLSTLHLKKQLPVKGGLSRFCKAQRLACDQVLALDDQVMDALLNDQEVSSVRKIDIADITQANQHLDWPTLLAFLKSLTPAIKQFNVSVLSTDNLAMIARVQEVFPDIKIKESHKKIIARSTIKLSHDRLNLDDKWVKTDISQIEKLDLSHSPITVSDLQVLLKATPNLKHLDLNHCAKLSEGALESFVLEKLKKLNLMSAVITPSSIQTLLKAAPNLEDLDLSECGELSESALEGTDLQKLKTLRLGLSAITASGLNTLLKKTLNLEYLDLSEYENFSESELEGIDLQKLKTLYLALSAITANSLQALLTATPNLEHLNLSNCDRLNDGKLEELDLQKLRVLILSGSSITDTGLKALLEKTTSLERLELGACNNLSASALEGLDLKCLKQLHLSSSTVTGTDLKTVLENTPNLEYLNLCHCKNLSSGVLEDLDLKNLKVLILSAIPLANEVANIANL